MTQIKSFVLVHTVVTTRTELSRQHTQQVLTLSEMRLRCQALFKIA